MQIILALAITLALETGIYMILKHRSMKLFIVVSILNIVLNLSMNIGLMFTYSNNIKMYWVILSICEIATVFIESFFIFIFMKIKYWRVLLFALIANAVSFSFGLTLHFIYIYEKAAIILSAFFFSIYLFTYGFILFTTIKRHYQIDQSNNQTDEQNESSDNSNDN